MLLRDFLSILSGRRSSLELARAATSPADAVATWNACHAGCPVHSLLDDAVARHGEKPAVDFLGKSYTYGEIGDLVDRAAKGFQLLGVGRGVRVGLFLPNSPYFVVCYYAVLKAGGTVVNLNPLYAPREIAHLIADSGAMIVVTLDLKQFFPKIAALADETGLRNIVVCSMNAILPPLKGLLFNVLKRSEIAAIPESLRYVSFDLLTRNGADPHPVDIDIATDIAVLQYTGGTTGVPKGAMLTHANLYANATQIRELVPGLGDGTERVLAVLPMFHVFAMTVALNLGVSIGAELILLPRFALDQVLKTIDAERPTVFPGVPTIYTAINACPDVARYDLSSIRYCISGGAPLPTETKRAFEANTGCVLVEGYGLSEASPVVACNPLTDPGKSGSVGRPVPGTVIEIRALDEPRKTVAPGAKGEVCVRGPQVMAGYWQRPEETKAALAGGVLHTGDVGYIDDDGYLFLVDRIKDLILCGGYNVYPRVVEEAVAQHPDVEEVVVIGVPDAYRGQSPKAFVRLRRGAGLDAEALRAFLSERLSPIEMPRDIEFRAELPKTMIGKLSKKELIEEDARARLDADASGKTG